MAPAILVAALFGQFLWACCCLLPWVDRKLRTRGASNLADNSKATESETEAAAAAAGDFPLKGGGEKSEK